MIDLIFLSVMKLMQKKIIKSNPEFQDKIKAAKRPLKSVVFHMSFSKKSKAIKLIPEINKIIEEMKKDGTIENILSK